MTDDPDQPPGPAGPLPPPVDAGVGDEGADPGAAYPGYAPSPQSVPAGEMFADEPLPAAPPPTATDEDLRAAVGVAPAGRSRTATPAPAKPRARTQDDDDDGPPKPRGRAPLIAAIAALTGGVIAAFVLVGRSNAGRFVYKCGETTISAQRGRAFPPWGERRMTGAEWKPIAIPPGAECKSRETESRVELTQWYLDALLEQAQAKLTAKEVTQVDAAQAELEQALLLARDPEKRDQRKEVERLLGDVEYWRGAARVKSAIETLDEAARRYDAAAEKRPRHASDAAAWAEWLRGVSGRLREGPSGAEDDEQVDVGTVPVTPTRPAAPTGVPLPVERDADAAVTPPVDAGVPRGGVLL